MIIIPTKDKNIKGRLFEELMQSILRDLGFVELTLVPKRGLFEIDISAKHKLPPHSPIMCECKAHEDDIDITSILTFLGKYCTEDLGTSSLTAYFFSLSELTGPALKLYQDKIQKHPVLQKGFWVLPYQEIINLLVDSGKISHENTIREKVRRIFPQKKISSLDLIYWYDNFYWLIKLTDNKGKVCYILFDSHGEELLSNYSDNEIVKVVAQYNPNIQFCDLPQLPSPPESNIHAPEGMLDIPLIGRSREIEELNACEEKIIGLVGLPGIGKTALASLFIEQNSDKYDLIYRWNLRKIQTIPPLIESLFKELSGGKLPLGLSIREQINEINKILFEKRCLIVLETMEDWVNPNTGMIVDPNTGMSKDKDKDKDLLQYLFKTIGSGSHRSRLILTSRVHIAGLPSYYEYPVEGLKIEDALEFLQTNLPLIPKEDLKSLAKSVDYHPYTLKWMSNLIRDNVYTIAELIFTPGLLTQGIEGSFNMMWEGLSEIEKKLLSQLSVFKEPVRMATIQSMMSDYNADDVAWVVTLLVRKLLVRRSEKTGETENLYSQHRVIQEYAKSRLGEEDTSKAHFLAYKYYVNLFSLKGEPKELADIQPLVRACYHATKAGKFEEAYQSIFNKGFHKKLRDWGNAATLLDLCLFLFDDENKRQEFNETFKEENQLSVILLYAGIASSDLGQPKEAIKYYEEAWEICKDFPLANKEKRDVIGRLGVAYSHLGQSDKVFPLYRQAVEESKSVGDKKNHSLYLGYLGLEHGHIGKHIGELEEALQICQEALKISEEIKDTDTMGRNYCNVGAIYRYLGDFHHAEGKFTEAEFAYKKAEEFLNKSIAMSQQCRDKRGEGRTCIYLGSVLCSLKRKDEAKIWMESTLQIIKEARDRRREGIANGRLANIYYHRWQEKKKVEEIHKAEELYIVALNIHRDIGNQRDEAIDLIGLGKCYEDENKLKEAIACYISSRDVSPIFKHKSKESLNRMKEKHSNLFTQVQPDAAKILKEILKPKYSPY